MLDQSLVISAKSFRVANRTNGRVSPASVALAMAYINGEVTSTQLTKAIGGKKGGNYWPVKIIRQGVAAGYCKIVSCG